MRKKRDGWRQRWLLTPVFALASVGLGSGCADGNGSASQAVRPSQDAATDLGGDVATGDGACPISDAGSGGPDAQNTFINAQIQIDNRALFNIVSDGGFPDGSEAGPASLSPDDGNLVLGNDGNSDSWNVPLTSPVLPYIDWASLTSAPYVIANHVVDDDVGTDRSAFQRKDSCVTVNGETANVLSHGDLDVVFFANNAQHACVAGIRRDNGGNGNLLALFTKNPAILVEPNQANGCHANERNVEYDITGSTNANDARDVLLFLHFNPGGTNARAFRAKTCRHVTALEALRFDDTTLWEEVTFSPNGGITAYAINTTTTPTSTLEPYIDDAVARSPSGSGFLATELLTEACASMNVFTGGQTLCDVVFNASFFTNSTGQSLEADIKDMGPLARIVLGGLSATPSITPNCNAGFSYGLATLTGPAGNAIDPSTATCSWSFQRLDAMGNPVGSPITPMTTSCTGNVINSLTPAVYRVTVDVSTTTTCSKHFDFGTVTVDPIPSVTVNTTPLCSGFNYSATPANTRGTVSYSWTFTGTPGTPSTTTGQSGTFSGASSMTTYTAAVTLTDARTYGNCQANNSAMATPFSPIQVRLDLRAAADMCPALGTNASASITESVTYDAVVTGGSNPTMATLTWLSGPCAGMSVASCMVDPMNASCRNATLQVRATDPNPMSGCGSDDSEVESYALVTTITASNCPATGCTSNGGSDAGTDGGVDASSDM